MRLPIVHSWFSEVFCTIRNYVKLCKKLLLRVTITTNGIKVYMFIYRRTWLH